MGAFWTKNVCEPPQNFSTRTALGPAYYFYLRGPTLWLICLPYLLVDYARNFASRNRVEVKAGVKVQLHLSIFRRSQLHPLSFHKIAGKKRYFKNRTMSNLVGVIQINNFHPSFKTHYIIPV